MSTSMSDGPNGSAPPQVDPRRAPDEFDGPIVVIDEALRAASLLIRRIADVGDTTLTVEPPSHDRVDRLRSSLADRQAVGYAVGMIGQRLGLDAAEAAEHLRAYAAFATVTVAAAARMVVEREVDIDTVMSVLAIPGAPR